MTPRIPTGPEQLTQAWLVRALRRDPGPVWTERIGKDEGFTGGGLFRLHLGNGETLIAKLAPADPAMRAALAAANRREVAFYTDLAAELPVPRCAYAAFDVDTGASVLLLQDLRDCAARAFVEGATVPEARAMVQALAEIHARWWDAPEADALQGGGLIAEFDFAAAWKSYPAALQSLLPGAVLPPQVTALGDLAAAEPERVFGTLLDGGPSTLLHRDCHVDNAMFAPDGTALWLDWQIMGRGRGAWDLGYALVSSLPPAVRRVEERGMVADYLAELQSRGVAGYGWEECWRDYRRAIVAKLFLTVVATALLDNSGPAKIAWRRADLDRLLAFCGDHAIGPWIFDPDQDTA